VQTDTQKHFFDPNTVKIVQRTQTKKAQEISDPISTPKEVRQNLNQNTAPTAIDFQAKCTSNFLFPEMGDRQKSAIASSQGSENLKFFSSPNLKTMDITIATSSSEKNKKREG
jgi:hypothetical protein